MKTMSYSHGDVNRLQGAKRGKQIKAELLLTADIIILAASDLLSFSHELLFTLLTVTLLLYLPEIMKYMENLLPEIIAQIFPVRKKNILLIGQLWEEKAENFNLSGKNVNLAGILLPGGSNGNNDFRDIKIMGTYSQIESVVRFYGIDEVFIAETNEDLELIFGIIDRCCELGVNINIALSGIPLLYKRLKVSRNFGMSFLLIKSKKSRVYSFVIKRIVDLFVSITALIVLSPVLLLISALIKLTSPGPVIFSQERVGKNGKKFKMYKFRTMNNLAGEDEERKEMMIKFMRSVDSGGNTKVVNHKRITKIGKFLRKTSLDEFPQLVNVIKGDMSIVGPRPDIPYEFENYEQWQKRRIRMLPGCTGLWQVTGRSEVSFNESVILDIYYGYQINTITDMKIILKTIPVILFSRGGE